MALKAGGNPTTLFEQIKLIENQYINVTHVLTNNVKIGVVLEKNWMSMVKFLQKIIFKQWQ